MVFFVCEDCNETLKRLKVAAHLCKCSCSAITCVDCNKSFYDDSYLQHSTCMSEAERYEGNLYKAPKKKTAQDAWAELVQAACADRRDAPPAAAKLLPRLQSAEVPLGDMHTARRQIWGDGPYPTLVHESWQSADAGAVTLPPIDDDNQSPRVTMGTYIVVVEGSELIVAWKRTDMHETDAIRTLPLLDSLHTVPSLTILRAVAGDVIYMPRDTVHMVVTEAHKVHLAFHVYE